MGAGLQRCSVTAYRLEITVVLLLPFVDAVKLGGDAVLQHSCLRLTIYLFLYLVIDNLVALGQRHPFQRIGRRDLGFCPVWHQAEGKNDQTNDS